MYLLCLPEYNEDLLHNKSGGTEEIVVKNFPKLSFQNYTGPKHRATNNHRFKSTILDWAPWIFIYPRRTGSASMHWEMARIFPFVTQIRKYEKKIVTIMSQLDQNDPNQT